MAQFSKVVKLRFFAADIPRVLVIYGHHDYLYLYQFMIASLMYSFCVSTLRMSGNIRLLQPLSIYGTRVPLKETRSCAARHEFLLTVAVFMGSLPICQRASCHTSEEKPRWQSCSARESCWTKLRWRPGSSRGSSRSLWMTPTVHFDNYREEKLFPLG